MPAPQDRDRSSNVSQHSATGAAIRRGELKISDPIPFETGSSGCPPSAALDMTTVAAAPYHDATWPSHKVSPSEIRRPARNASLGHGQTSEISRASAGPSLVPSSLSAGPSKNSLAQRKNSGFRATLKRMFGSKRGRNSFVERRDFHQSDPGNLTSIREKSTTARATQSPSRRAGSVTRASALGSHQPHPETNNLPRSSSERNRLKSPRRRRRNTLPSLILTDQEAQILAGPKDDLSAKLWKRAEPTEAYLKRRSRSADALNDLVASYSRDDSPQRDRASEIAYWRTSVIENPTPIWSDARRAEYEQPAESARDVVKLEPIQTFDFGLMKAGADAATLDERVTTLEVRSFNMEYAISGLQGNDLPKPSLYPRPPKRRSIHELFPDNGTRSTLASSSSGTHEPTSFLTSPDESPIPSTEHEESFRPDRSSKATTIRPLNARRRSSRRSNAPSPSPARISADQFEAMMDTLKQEQAARKRLEAQVVNQEQQIADLRKDLAALRTPVYAEIRPNPFPTPSPESIHETPMAHRSLHRSPRFEYEKTPQQESSRFSMSEVDTDTDDGYQDVYETPQENRYMFGTPRGSPLVGVS